MISLTDNIPEVFTKSAELIKLKATYNAYKNDGLFWVQNEGQAYIDMIDGNTVIFNNGADLDELKDFIDVINPACVFSDIDTLKAIGKTPKEEISVMYIKAEETSDRESDTLSSRQLYDLLNVDGLSLPDYPHFAVDICYRLNHGQAEYFAIKDTCAAISFHTGDYAIMNGIASHKKGFGGIALKNILAKNSGRYFLVCCRQKIKGFYEKLGFEELYKAGYWVVEK
jgi:hypothetical protein